MVVRTLDYKKTYWSKLQDAEMKYMRCLQGQTNGIRNETLKSIPERIDNLNSTAGIYVYPVLKTVK